MTATCWALARSRTRTFVCLGCGEQVTKKLGSRDVGKYCSRECAFADPHWRGRTPAQPRRCKCGEVLPFRKRICEACRLPPKRVSRACVICGALFLPKTYKSNTCSEKCARKRPDRRKNKRAVQSRARRKRRVTFGKDTARKRARRLGVPYEVISRIKVFTVAGWRCSICGKRTPRSQLGTMTKRAPELDHIVPWALGGGHVYDNVQLLCRTCNMSKRDRIRGQLRLSLGVNSLAGGPIVLY